MDIPRAERSNRRDKGRHIPDADSSSRQESVCSISDREIDLLHRSLLSIFRPIVRLAINSNVDARRLVEIIKVAFVDVATEEYGIRGRPTTTARVSIMSGLTRKEVGAIKDLIATGLGISDASTTICQRLLDSWWTKETYTNAPGRPMELPFSDGTPSFVQLCQEVGGDFPPGAARTELLRTGSVELLEGKRMRALRRAHATTGNYEEFAVGLSDFIAASMISEELDSDVEDLASEAAIVRAIRDQ
ncbi:MAG: DUF6502 family protein [Pseudomonadota bacterium]